MKALKILIITMDHFPSIGGIQTFVYDISVELKKRGHIVKVLNFDGRDKKNDSVLTYSDFFYSPATQNAYYPLKKILNPFMFFKDGGYRDFVFSNMIHRITKKEILLFKPDLIHSMKNSLYASVFDSSVPFIVSCHMGAEDIANEYSIQYSLTNARKIHSISNYIKKLVKKINSRPNKDIQVIYNPIDLTLYKKIKVKKKKQIITVSRLVKGKNIETLIKAYGCLPKNIRDDFNYIIVGDGPELQALKKLVKKQKLDTIHFKGEIQSVLEKIKLLKESAIFLLCPEAKDDAQEAFGMVYLEAQAAGLPIVCSRIGGIPEAVGKAGAYVSDERNPLEISKILTSLLTDKVVYSQYINEGKKRIHYFDKASWIKSMLALYSAALSENH